MLGPEGVAVLLSSYLCDLVPALADRLAEQLGPVDPNNPDLTGKPVLFASTQLEATGVGIDDWPFVLTVAQELHHMERTDVLDSGEIVYRCTYPVRVFQWARGDGFHSTARVRDRMVLAVRESLLLRQTFNDARFTIDESSLVERYSDIAVDSDLAATIAAASIDFDVVVSETLVPLDPAGPPVTEAALDTQPLPPHPAL